MTGGAVRLRPRWAGALALALLAGPFLTGSSQAAPSDVVPGSDPAALALLRSAVRAESTLTYGGVEDVTSRTPTPTLAARRRTTSST